MFHFLGSIHCIYLAITVYLSLSVGSTPLSCDMVHVSSSLFHMERKGWSSRSPMFRIPHRRETSMMARLVNPHPATFEACLCRLTDRSQGFDFVNAAK